MIYTYRWRGQFDNHEVSDLHDDAFHSGDGTDSETDWSSLLAEHSLGWVTAREGIRLVGFVNVIWDGEAHAWIQDVMVSSTSRNQGVGTQLVAAAREASGESGCEWLHVDFEERLGKFCFDACGFEPTSAGLIQLRQPAFQQIVP